MKKPLKKEQRFHGIHFYADEFYQLLDIIDEHTGRNSIKEDDRNLKRLYSKIKTVADRIKFRKEAVALLIVS